MDKEYNSLPVDTLGMGDGVIVWAIQAGDSQLDSWEVFCIAADQWFINYAMPYSILPAVKLFSIGHTVELYLKAVLTKLSGNVDIAISKGHNIKRIWDECKSRDSKFMAEYEIRDSVLNAPIHDDQALQSALSQDDYSHLLHNQELYVITKILPDLKYLGAPLKKVSGNYSFGYIHPSPYWLRFVRAIRLFLGERVNSMDLIRSSLDNNAVSGFMLPDQTKSYLQRLYDADV